jgi:hypothetical protein
MKKTIRKNKMEKICNWFEKNQWIFQVVKMILEIIFPTKVP